MNTLKNHWTKTETEKTTKHMTNIVTWTLKQKRWNNKVKYNVKHTDNNEDETMNTQKNIKTTTTSHKTRKECAADHATRL